MRIVMLLDNAFKPDPRVGSEARSLAEAGHQVTILAWDREGERRPCEQWHGVRVERIAVRTRHRLGSAQVFFLLRFWWAALWRLLYRRFDAVHCHDFSTLPLGCALAFLTRCRLVYDAHESYADMLAQNVAPWIRRLVARAERRLIRRADAVITVGQRLADELRQRGGRDVRVVGNWKRLADFRRDEAEVAARRAELGLGDRRLVVYIGYLNRDRGILPLLDAVRELDRVGLLLGGDGELDDAVRQAVGDCWRIHYLGFVNPAEIPLYTAMADVIYYGLDAGNPNARFSAPNKLFEALAAGKAVLCNNCGEVGRIVQAEDCGIVVDRLTPSALRSAIEELADPQRLADVQRRAREAGQRRYNWQEAERTLLGLYRGLAGEARSHG